MLRKSHLMAILVFYSLQHFACEKSIPTDKVFQLLPVFPVVGGKITITYNPGAELAVLKDVHEIIFQAMITTENSQPKLIEYQMSKENQIWKKTITLDVPNANLMLIRFVSGDQIDNNRGDGWHQLVFNHDGNPVKGAHLALATTWRRAGLYGFKHRKDMIEAKNEVNRELELYPDNWQAYDLKWEIERRMAPTPETMAAIKSELETVSQRHKSDEEAVVVLLYWFEQTDQSDRAAKIRSEFILTDPRGRMAEIAIQRKIYTTADPEKKITLLEQYIKEFNPEESQWHDYLFHFYLSQNKIEKAIQFLKSGQTKNPLLYNALAQKLIIEKTDINGGISLAKEGIGFYRNEDLKNKPSYLSVNDWRQSNQIGLSRLLDTYASGLMQQKNFTEAESALEEAYQLSKGENKEICSHLADCYYQNGKTDKALEFCEAVVRSGKSNDHLITIFKTVYHKKYGTNEGFESLFSKAKGKAESDELQKLIEMKLNIPAIDFSLLDLNGKTVRLSDLTNKVVVLDFWATWCGPCKTSFPVLQQLYDKYKGNDVVFLALNTWERKSGEERKKLVRDFIEKNNYTFRVLFDTDLVDKYGVTAIPTKFIIDRQGKIQFKSMGFDGAEQMFREMSMQIDLLLQENSAG